MSGRFKVGEQFLNLWSCLAVCSFQRTKITRYTVAVADVRPYRFSQGKVARRADKNFFERISPKSFFALRGEVL